MLNTRYLVGTLIALGTLLFGIGESRGQVLGTFRWRFEPFCNVVHLTVTQEGSAISLLGFDDNCGFTNGSPASGTVFVSSDGTFIGNITIVKAGGITVNNSIELNPATASGTWSDNFNNSGVFAFNPDTAPGSPRPTVSIPPEASGWLNVNANATLRSASANLTGTSVLRPPANPTGVYCLVFPDGAPVTGEAAVGSVQQGTGGDGIVSFITVTVTFGNLCNAVGSWDVAVQTYDSTGKPADRPFTLVIPGSH